MWKPATVGAFLGLSLLSATAPLNGREVLAVQVSPVVAREPAFVTVQATIEPDEENRTLRIVLDSPDFFRSSEIQLDGSRAPRLVVFEYPKVRAGRYSVTGTLTGADGRRAVALKTLNVAP